MDSTWQVVKWMSVGFFGLYLVVQVLAVRRLKGDLKKRAYTVLLVMTIVMGACDAVRNVFFFENRVADRVDMLVVSGVGIVATILLIRMFGQSSVVAMDDRDRAEDYVRPLKLG